MKRHYFLILLISIFAVSSCSYNQLALNPNNGNYVVSYDDSIPDSLKRTIAITFDNARVEDKNKTRIYLKNFNSSIYNIYAGSSLRSLEGEITAFASSIIFFQVCNSSGYSLLKRGLCHNTSLQ